MTHMSFACACLRFENVGKLSALCTPSDTAEDAVVVAVIT
jgi:hypothetical protein